MFREPDVKVKSNLVFPNTCTYNLETKKKWTITINEINLCQKLRFQIDKYQKVVSPCLDTVEITDIIFLLIPSRKGQKHGRYCEQ